MIYMTKLVFGFPLFRQIAILVVLELFCVLLLCPSAFSIDRPTNLRGEGLSAATTDGYNYDQVGGGDGYGNLVAKWDRFVKNKDELITALKSSTSSQVIYVDDNVSIDLTGLTYIGIPGGITLASGRGKDGSIGALLFTNKLETPTLFQVNGNNVRVTGLRIQGPYPGTERGGPLSRGIVSASESNPDIEIDNCELMNWSFSAIYFKNISNARVHHNYIHHNQMNGYGYGVDVLGTSDVVAEANLFDFNRHSIASDGLPTAKYEAKYNIVLEHGISHSFDMHGGDDRGDGTQIAGKQVLIHHNKFYINDFHAIAIRGVPVELSLIHNNCFAQNSADESVWQVHATGNLSIYDNVYGGCK